MMRPVPHNKVRKIVVVGTSNLKRSEGKASSLYFPKFGYALAKREVALIGYHGPAEAFRGLKDCDPARTAVILVCNETRERHLLRDFAEFAQENAEFTFYKGPKTGTIIGDKPAANRELFKAGILTPPLADGTTRVFSNAPMDSHATTSVVDAGQPLNHERYNTRFINTVRVYNGKSYYVALRALAVSGTMIAAYARLRPTGESEASVHAADTPLDPQLISHFHETIVEENRKRLANLCERLGQVWGPGFYAHDILPCSDTDALYVCESGFKFDDMAYRTALWPISSDLPFLSDHFTVRIADIAAQEISNQCFGHDNR